MTACCLLLVLVVGGQAARVQMELGTQPGYPQTGMQAWYQTLTDLKVDDLRIRSQAPGQRLEIVVQGTPQAPTYRVVGLLTIRNELVLPDARFTLADRARLAEWLRQLRARGPAPPPDAPRVPFGLTSDQLAALEADLTTKVDFSTKGKPLTVVLNTLGGRLRHPVLADPDVVPLLTAAEPVADELEGFAAGMALAAALRPAGLVMAPRGDGAGGVQLVAARSKSDEESWPLGRRPTTPAPQVAPVLFETINVNIDDVSLAQVLEVVAGRTELPLLFDQAALARRGIDTTQIRVRVPQRELAYESVLSKVLFQGRLKHELRVDDAGKPFLWITTLVP